MEEQDVAILYSGGRDSLSLYVLSIFGAYPEVPKARMIHLLHMLNGMGRFPTWPRQRWKVAERIIKRQIPGLGTPFETSYVELDMGRLFQGLWLDWYEELMPKYGGKNLVCVACKLAMHTRAILYCIEHYVPLLLVGYTERQTYYPEQTPAFMQRMARFSEKFGIRTAFPLFEEFSTEEITRHFLEDHGLPSTGGGERKCLFCQTRTTATEREIGAYLDDMIPRVSDYINMKLEKRIHGAADCFPPGVIHP